MTRFFPVAVSCLFAVSTGAIAQNATENAAPPAETRQDMAARAEAACPSLLRFANSFGMSHCQCLARSVTADSMDQADADLITTTLTKPGIIFRAAARNMRMGLSEEGIKAVDACTG